ncbi:MAG: hypothetical protein ACK55Z_12475, partial [bacterium]
MLQCDDHVLKLIIDPYCSNAAPPRGRARLQCERVLVQQVVRRWAFPRNFKLVPAKLHAEGPLLILICLICAHGNLQRLKISKYLIPRLFARRLSLFDTLPLLVQ